MTKEEIRDELGRLLGACDRPIPRMAMRDVVTALRGIFTALGELQELPKPPKPPCWTTCGGDELGECRGEPTCPDYWPGEAKGGDDE